MADRCTIVGGDFFAEVHGGGDLYVLKRVLNDWPDERAAAILRNCYRAMAPGATLLVVDHIVPDGIHSPAGAAPRPLDAGSFRRQGPDGGGVARAAGGGRVYPPAHLAHGEHHQRDGSNSSITALASAVARQIAEPYAPFSPQAITLNTVQSHKMARER